MKKKRLILIALLLFALILSGCSSPLQEQFDQLQKEHSSLQSDFNQLQSDCANLLQECAALRRKCEALQNKPDIVVSLTDDLDAVRTLTLYDSLENAQDDYTLFFTSLSSKDKYAHFTITLNCDSSLKDIFYVDTRGRIESIMPDVGNVGNTYTFITYADWDVITSLILELEDGTLWYCSYKYTTSQLDIRQFYA